jgi:DNA polymerase-3 subunit alpha
MYNKLMKFTHLHVHSHYSLLDGLPQVPDLVAHAKNAGFEALALTDHGVMYGAIEFYNECRAAGIKPIVGVEAYVAPRSMLDKEGKADSSYFHLTLLCKNYEGYLNLMKLVTAAELDGFYYKPRMDRELLAKHSAGLIALSGCQRGEVYRATRDGGTDAGQAALDEYLKIFGRDNFFLEIQRNELDGKRDPSNEKVIADFAELGKKNSVRLVATADSHYLTRDDAEAQDVLVCIGTGRTTEDTDRLNMTGYDLSLRGVDKMCEIFSDYPDAVQATNDIAAACDLEIPINQRYFPVYETPAGESPEDYLREITFERAKKFYAPDGTGELPQTIVDRLNYELDIIVGKGFATYFLVVADIVNASHAMDVVTNTRGSAAGSMVAYVTGITYVDPVLFQLPFERFLTMHRPTPPDIDLDIADNRRDDVIAYITQKYGRDKVAQIITFGTMKARAAIRDVGRALGVAYSKCDRIAKMVPLGKQGFDMTIDHAMSITPELKEIYERDAETHRVIDIAKRIEGGARHASVHAAGVVITPTDLTDYTPLQHEPDGEKIITQYDMYALDSNANGKAIGVVKMDMLGIRNLAILEGALKIVKARHGMDIDIYHLPEPDAKTYKMLGEGHTFGVFQMGGSGMTRYLKELRPKSIFDLQAMVALYRPGPMQNIPDYIARSHNNNLVRYLDPSMQHILERSYGVLVYQDDLLAIAHDIAGYTWEEVDKFRKAVGKKIVEEMVKQKVKFIEGCGKTSGLSPARAAEIWAWIEPFAAYGFNKSHAASYAQVSYQTAYMKANYTVEFMAAVMTAEAGDAAKAYAAVEECRSMGIAVLPPDVNESLNDFTVIDEHNIRFGLHAIKNLGSDVTSRIKEERARAGKFKNLRDFALRLGGHTFNRRSWEALVKCGAMDSFGERGQLLENSEGILAFARDHAKSAEAGQESLFGKAHADDGDLNLKPAAAATMDEKLTWEKELLGMYVSAHPLDNYKRVLTRIFPIGSLREDMVSKDSKDRESNIEVGGIISKVKRSMTKKGEPMMFIQLEDKTGSIEAIVFPKTLDRVRQLIELERVVQLKGRLSDKDGEFKLLVEEISDLPNDMIYDDKVAEIAQKSQLVITLPAQVTQDALQKLKAIVERYPGTTDVSLEIGSGASGKVIKAKSQVAFNDDLVVELKSVREVQRVRVVEKQAIANSAA